MGEVEYSGKSPRARHVCTDVSGLPIAAAMSCSVIISSIHHSTAVACLKVSRMIGMVKEPPTSISLMTVSASDAR